MEIVDNLETLHRKDGSADSIKSASKADLGDHIHIFREAMNMIWALLHECRHTSEGELKCSFSTFAFSTQRRVRPS